jgi:hypothetical protein
MGTSFKDLRGREWTVVIDGYVLYRARTDGKVDLGEIVSGAMGGRKIDPSILVELCFYGCEHHSRIESGKVSKEEFLRTLTGKVMPAALEATADAVAECFGIELGEEDEAPPGPPEDADRGENGPKPIG